MCEGGRSAPRGMDCKILHWLEKGTKTSVSKDAALEGGWIMRSHIGLRGKTFFISM